MDRRGSSAARRAASSARLSSSLILVSGQRGSFRAALADAAHIGEVAERTGPGAGIEGRIPGEECCDETLKRRSPAAKLRAPRLLRGQLRGGKRLQLRQQLRRAPQSVEAHAARVDVDRG